MFTTSSVLSTVLLQHQVQLLGTLNLVGFVLNEKKFELQDIQFLGIRLRLDSGDSSGDSNTCVQTILPSSPVLSSSGPTHGLTQLGLRSYPSGSFVSETLTTLFSFIRPDRPVITKASVRPLGPCQLTSAMAVAVFSYLWNPYPSVSGGIYYFHGRLYSRLGRPHGGFPNFGYMGPSGPPAPYQLLETQGSRGCPTSLGPGASGPPGDDRYGQFNSSFLYQQVRRDSVLETLLRLVVALFMWLQAQNTVVRARHIPGCLNVIEDHLSRINQPISTEWSLHPEILRRIFGVWGTPVVDMFATVSISRLPQFISPVPEPRTLAVDALSQDWQGRSMYMFPPFPLLSKVIQKQRWTQEAEVILIAPWWPKQSWFPHLLHLCVDHPLFFPYRRDLLAQKDQIYVSGGKSYRLHARRLSCDTTKQQAFQTRSLGLPQHLGDPQPIACTTIVGFTSPDGLQGKDLTPLITQLLKKPPFYIFFLILACLRYDHLLYDCFDGDTKA